MCLICECVRLIWLFVFVCSGAAAGLHAMYGSEVSEQRAHIYRDTHSDTGSALSATSVSSQARAQNPAAYAAFRMALT